MAVTPVGYIGQPLIGNGAVSPPSFAALHLAALSNTSGVLPIERGGTGYNISPVTQYGVTYANTTTSMTVTGVGTAGQPLIGNGTGAAPSFAALNLSTSTNTSGSLPIGKGGTGTSFTALTPNGIIWASSATDMECSNAGTSGAILTAGLTGQPSFMAAGNVGQILTLNEIVPGLKQLDWKDFDQYFNDNYATSSSVVAPLFTTTSATFGDITTLTVTMKQGVVMIFPVAQDGTTFSNTIITATNNTYTTVNVRYQVTNPDASIDNYTYSFTSATATNNNQITGSITIPPLIFFSNTGGTYTVKLQGRVGTAGDTFQVSGLVLRVAQG